MDGLIRLEKLQLDNNIIVKIEGLDHLVNLKWLDLSFNNISKIEGLDHLVNLTDLSLYQNRITKIEGMDMLEKLNYFSIGNNEISSVDELVYLQKFKSLQVLIVQGNPFCKNESGNEKQYSTIAAEMRYSIIARLPQLKYLDYMMIDKESIDTAFKQYGALYKAAEDVLHEKPKMTIENEMHELEEANIGGMYNFAEKLKDPEMKKLELETHQKELWAKFEEELKEMVGAFQDNMKNMAKHRKEMMETCEKLLRDEEKEAEAKGVKCIEQYRREKKHIFRNIEDKAGPITDIVNLRKALKQLDADLMRVEMDHVELASHQVANKFSSALETVTHEMWNRAQSW